MFTGYEAGIEGAQAVEHLASLRSERRVVRRSRLRRLLGTRLVRLGERLAA